MSDLAKRLLAVNLFQDVDLLERQATAEDMVAKLNETEEGGRATRIMDALLVEAETMYRLAKSWSLRCKAMEKRAREAQSHIENAAKCLE